MEKTTPNFSIDAAASRRLYGLRGAAILLVLCDHYNFYPFPYHLGPAAVRLFFILSGFHVTLSFWKTRERNERAGGKLWKTFRSFYWSRFLRIAPLFYGGLLAGVLLELPEARRTLGWDCLFLTNFYVLKIEDWPLGTAHFWSLAIQEQFYLLWPFLLLLAWRWSFRGTIVLSVALSLLFRYYCDSQGLSPFCKWMLLPGCWDSFMAGAVLAHLYARGHDPEAVPAFIRPLFHKRFWLIIALAIPFLLSVAIACIPQLAPIQFLCETLEAISLAGMVWYAFQNIGLEGFLGNRHLVHIGKMSYYLYVFQAFLYCWIWGKLVDRFGTHFTPLAAWGCFIGVTAVGILVLGWLRKGITFARQRFFPRKASA